MALALGLTAVPKLTSLIFTAQDIHGDLRRRRLATQAVVAVAAMGFLLSVACPRVEHAHHVWQRRARPLAYVEDLLAGELPTVDENVRVDGHLQALAAFYPAVRTRPASTVTCGSPTTHRSSPAS